MNAYPGPNTGPSSQDTSVEPYSDHQEPKIDYPEPMPVHQDLGHDLILEGNEPITDYQDPQPDHTEIEPASNAQAPSGGGETNQDHGNNIIEDERLDRIEEDVQQLSLGLETLRGTVTGLEASLRASLREDANRMLTALISVAPSPIAAPSLSRDSSVGFGDLPGGAPDIEGSDVVGQFPNLVDLAEKVSELRAELVAKASELEGLRGAIKELTNGWCNPTQDHIEGMLEGRLAYVESKMNIALNQEEASINKRVPTDLETQIEGKLKALESRLLAAVDELGNVTAPTLLQGQAVPTLETDVESLRRSVEDDLDRLQKQLKSIEVMCTSSCVPQPILTGYAAPLATEEEKIEDNHKELNGKLDLQVQRLNNLNATLYNLLVQLAEKQEEVGLKGEVTLLKVSVNSVNRSLCGLQESLGSVIREVGHTNLTWQEREERLAQQVKGVVQLVGRQASMLGTGERKLTRLKGELKDLRRRVAGELQGCRSTALGVQKEVDEVGGRVARVEGQCGGLAHLADDLERIRGELERHSEGYLSHVNSTLC
ncbi:unnamed protein product [Leuciscus chuanchicus]